MNWSQRRTVVIVVMLVLVGWGGLYWLWYWWQNTLSHDFRKDAVEAVAELNSFKDTDECSGALLYGFAVERIDLAVRKAEAEVSNAADREAAIYLRLYYKALTDRDNTCSQDQKTVDDQYLKILISKDMVEANLGISHSEN